LTFPDTTPAAQIGQPIQNIPATALPRDLLDTMAIHLLVRNVGYMTHGGVAHGSRPSLALLQDKADPAARKAAGTFLGQYFSELNHRDGGITSSFDSTNIDGAGVTKFRVVSKRPGFVADIWQEVVTPVIRNVAAAAIPAALPGSWKSFAYHGGYHENHHACCSGGNIDGGKDVGCGIKCRPHIPWRAAARLMTWINAARNINNAAGVPLAVAITVVAVKVQDILTDVTGPFGVKHNKAGRYDINNAPDADWTSLTTLVNKRSPAVPAAILDEYIRQAKQEVIVSFTGATAQCGDTLVNVASFNGRSGVAMRLWAKQTKVGSIPNAQDPTQEPLGYPTVSVCDHSKGMFSTSNDWICHGDINRQGGVRSESLAFMKGNNEAGGGGICAQIPAVNEVWHAITSLSFTCSAAALPQPAGANQLKSYHGGYHDDNDDVDVGDTNMNATLHHVLTVTSKKRKRSPSLDVKVEPRLTAASGDDDEAADFASAVNDHAQQGQRRPWRCQDCTQNSQNEECCYC
jgi:hypothetical protein